MQHFDSHAVRLRPGPARVAARQRTSLRALLAAWVMLLATPAGVQASELRHTATVKSVEQARPSIVNIHGQKNLTPADDGYRQGEQPQRVNGMGTGVVVDERGYIVTNHHVVEGVKKIEVTLASGNSHIARLISHDPKTDLAIIKINATEKLPPITIGTSSDLMPGEPVVAVGNAYGYEHTVTRGIISALHRTVPVSDTQSYRDLIQTDASINPGNSGGPLLNIDGEMIGLNVAVRAGAQGIGFAIPVDAAMEVAAQLMSVERLESTYHGLVARRAGSAPACELVVDELDDDSPAAKCGLLPGDKIVSIDNRQTARLLDVERAILGRKPGDAVEIKLKRKGQSLKVSLALAGLPGGRVAVADRTWDLIGLKLAPVPADRLPQTKTRYRGGLRVASVRPDSPAAKRGIQRGDVLVGMHIWETISLDNVAYILNRPDFAEIEPLKFYIVRGEETLFGHLTVSGQR